MFDKNLNIVSPLTTRIVMALCDSPHNSVKTMMEVPHEIALDLPGDAVIDIAHGVNLTCWGTTKPDNRLIFELSPPLLESSIEKIQKASKTGGFNINLFR